MADYVQAVTHDLLMRELSQVPQWDVLGTYLGLSESDIEVIERDHHDTARRRLVMLSKWLEKDADPSWEKVIDSLESMSQIRLANQLKKKYCTSESNPPATAAGPKPADSSLEKELMVDRKELIAHKIEEIEEQYLLLVTSVHSAMAEANPSLIKLQMFSKFYAKIKVATTEELLDLLEPFYFLEYALLERIVMFFLGRTHSIADDLRDYLQQLDCFKTSTTIRQFMESIEQAQQSHSTTSERPGLCTVKLRLVGGWLTKTMDDLEKLVNEIFQDKRYVLTHLKIVRGSVIVTFSAPLSEADSLIDLLLEESLMNFMLYVGVCEIVVADTMIAKSKSADFSFEYSLLGAILNNDLKLLMFLLSIHTSADGADSSGQTALMFGIHYNRVKAVSLLLKANADPNLRCKVFDGATPLYMASQKNRIDIISLLLKANADPNLQLNHGATPLYTASGKGHTNVVSLLLKANANPNVQSGDGATPLFMASQNGHTDIISLLLKANANPNVQCGDGATPLFIASYTGRTDIISLLLKANASPNLQHDEGTTPLYIASQEGHTDVISLLLKANANPNLQYGNGRTPLMIAALNDRSQIVQLLLVSGADPNLQHSSDITALMLACRAGCLESVELLMMSGTDPRIKSEGLTALDMAANRGHEDIVDLLQAIELSQSSTTSPVLTANEIAGNVDNEAMALVNRAIEQMLVKKTESLITAEYQKLKKTTLPPKQYGEESQNIY